MKTMFNLTTSSGDLDRFTDKNDLLHMMDGFDGVELMHFEDDVRGVIPKGRVIGYHTNFFYYWIDFFLGNNDALLHEFCSMEQCYKFYGGKTGIFWLTALKVRLNWQSDTMLSMLFSMQPTVRLRSFFSSRSATAMSWSLTQCAI